MAGAIVSEPVLFDPVRNSPSVSPFIFKIDVPPPLIPSLPPEPLPPIVPPPYPSNLVAEKKDYLVVGWNQMKWK